MIKNILKGFFVVSFVLFVFEAKADEGMWAITKLDSGLLTRLKDAGFELSGSQIYSESNPSLKDAVVNFDNGCSGEFVSNNGLLFTNHHCGRDRVQQVSTDANNYIRDGFWATSLQTEIPIKGLTIKYLIKAVDVTQQALDLLKTKSSRKVMAEIEKEYTDTILGYEASLDSYSTGQYIVAVYQVYRDVRLVGVPPESIGNFGGETDNFEWPRHAADFSIFRVYANKNNLPASYSEENVPYKPKTFLPISLDGIHENDFALTLGFPFSTRRSISSYELEDEQNVKNKATVITKGKYIEVLKKEMDNDEGVRLKYSTKNFSAGNSYKLALGTLKLIQLSPAFENKKLDEAAFITWAGQDPVRFKKYGHVLDTLAINYKEEYAPKYAHAVITGALFGDASLWGIRTRNLVEQLKKNDPENVEKAVQAYRQWYISFLKNYDVKTDQILMKALIKLVQREVAPEYLPSFYDIIKTKYKGDIDKYITDMYAKSIFVQPGKLEKYLNKPNLSIVNDPLYIFGTSIYEKQIELKKSTSKAGESIRKAEKLYAQGQRERLSNKLISPDANFSLRLTYGKVESANPRDGLEYLSRTTLRGLIEKEDTTNFEFYVWPDLKKLYQTKDYGRYGENGEMYTCFLTSTDITGGNSGSPVLNKKGELIGIAFDGNFESLASTFIYEKEKNRSINVDIRYVLFLIDKYAHSKYILNNLTIK